MGPKDRIRGAVKRGSQVCQAGVRRFRDRQEALVDRKMVMSVIGGGALMNTLASLIAWRLDRATVWLLVFLVTIPIAMSWRRIIKWAEETSEQIEEGAQNVEEAVDEDADSKDGNTDAG